jgi:hypothetical protein
MESLAMLLAAGVAVIALSTAPTASAQGAGKAERAGTSRIVDALAAYDRGAARPIWPGFAPSKIPLEIFDGGRTWLVRHPSPPAEFAEVPGHPEVRVFEGRHETSRANTSADVSGARTATASFEGKSDAPAVLAALLLHEAFHVFQANRHPKWGGDEGELFVYPVDDAEALALRRLESTAFERALAASSRAAKSRWAVRALEVRKRRFERIGAAAAAYERGTERKEGLARYVEAVATPSEPSLARPFPPGGAEFPADRIRERTYASGCAMALLLDSLSPGWKDAVERTDEPLEAALGGAVAMSSERPAEFSSDEIAAARSRARADVAAWTESRAKLRSEFLARSGWTVILETGPASPLFAQGFDPWNVERLGGAGAEVLHTRWLRLGNAAGFFEALDHGCLTESAGRHPLFSGVRRATVTGLEDEPRVDESNGRVRVDAKGLTLEFRGATAVRDEPSRSWTVSVPATPPS